MRDDRERLQDILEAIVRIEKYATRGLESFRDDELVQSWIVHHLQIIGEAVRALTEEFRRNNPSWPWAQIVGMRNILVHHYFEVDVAIVWSVVVTNLPDLKAKVTQTLKQLPTPPDS